MDLGINNSGSADALLFPQINISIDYGSKVLGHGWISEPIEIQGNEYKEIPIYVLMDRGDTFNKFFMSILAGGLSLSVSDVEIYVFFDTFAEIGPLASLMIPLDTLPLPMDMGTGDSTAFNPVLHDIFRDSVEPDQPINFSATVSDKKGGGVKEVILSYSVDSGAWNNVSMDSLPTKPLAGGSNTFIGSAFTEAFPKYPESPIPTLWNNATVSCSIPGVSNGSTVRYRVYVIDSVFNTVIGPETTPNNTIGSDTVDSNNNYFSFTVNPGTDNYTAEWYMGEGAGGVDLMTQLLDDLASSGIQIESLLLSASPMLAVLGDLNMTKLINDPDAGIEELMGALEPILIYMGERNVHGFEVVDQLMGLSGGSPMFEGEGLEYPGDINWTFNSNTSVALDMLSEAGIGLMDLMSILEVDISVLMDSIAENLQRPIHEGMSPSESLEQLSEEMLAAPTARQEFEQYLVDQNLDYVDFPDTHVYFRDQSASSWINYTQQANDTTIADVNLSGAVGDAIFFSTPAVAPTIGSGLVPISKMAGLQFEMSSNVNDGSMEVIWEFYNGTASAWQSIGIITDGTENLSQTGTNRIVFERDPNGMNTYINPPGVASIGLSDRDAYWVRMRIVAKNFDEDIQANMVQTSDYLALYYLETQNNDFFGRPQTEYNSSIQTVMDLMEYANDTNGYLGTVLGVFGYRDLQFEDLVQQLGGSFLQTPTPLTDSEVMQVQSLFLGIIIYLLLIFMVYLSIRSPSYDVPRKKVNKWFDEVTESPKKGGMS
jgi:hypothetical protein